MTPHEKLEALYATLPKIDCKKKCGFTNCGAIQASRMETGRIAEKTGFVKITPRSEWQRAASFQFRQLPYHLPKKEFYSSVEFYVPYEGTGCCQFLMPFLGTCRVYALRPMICRLWGLIDHPYMRCNTFGCVPERWLTPEEGRWYFQEVLKIEREAKQCQ